MTHLYNFSTFFLYTMYAYLCTVTENDKLLYY